MTQARTKFLRILYITLLLNMACAAGEDEANTAYEKSKVVVFRRSRTSLDELEICSTKSGEEIHFQTTERKSMICREPNRTICGRFGGETCTCRQGSPTFLISQKKCVSNQWLRQGRSR